MSGNAASIIHWTSGLVRHALPSRRSDLPPTPETAAVPEIDIVAYAGDSVLSGRILLSGERVSDVLNDDTEFWVTNGLVEDLVDGHAIEVAGVLLQRDEIFVVEADGPRGNVARRRRTCQFRILAKAGPYEVYGFVHALPGTQPINSLRGRKPMVAITDAVIGFTIGSKPHLRRADVVLLNQERLDWIVEAPGDGLMFERPAKPAGTLATDLTGYLHA